MGLAGCSPSLMSTSRQHLFQRLGRSWMYEYRTLCRGAADFQSGNL